MAIRIINIVMQIISHDVISKKQLKILLVILRMYTLAGLDENLLVMIIVLIKVKSKRMTGIKGIRSLLTWKVLIATAAHQV